MHRKQGLGSLTGTFLYYIELAMRAGARYSHNPRVTCSERGGRALDAIYELESRSAGCDANALWATALARHWPIVNLTMIARGSHLPRSLGRRTALEDLARQARMAAHLVGEGAPLVLHAVGCPWSREVPWTGPDAISDAALRWLHAPLSRADASRQSYPRARVIALHYRYGEFAPELRRRHADVSAGHQAPGGRAAITTDEIGRMYSSSIESLIAVVHRLLSPEEKAVVH